MRVTPRKTRKWAWLVILLVVCATAFALASCRMLPALSHRRHIRSGLRTPAEHGPARLVVYDRIPVLHLYGTPREMGEQHGTILKKALNSFDAYLTALLPEDMKDGFVSFAEEYEPHLPDDIRVELHAMAEASGMRYIDLVALNVVPRLRCSTLAVWGKATSDGRLVMGRNADYFGLGLSKIGSVMLVFHPREGIPLVSISYLGMIGAFTGVNEKGVAFGNMLVFNALDDGTQPKGLPVQLALRIAASKCGTAEEMSVFMRKRQQHMIPMNVMVADSREALVLELGIRTSDVRQGEKGILAASNDFRSRGMCEYLVPCDRYESLMEAARKHYGSLDAEAMKRALFPARMKNLNLQAAVFEPERRLMHVSINRMPAVKGPYKTLGIDELFAVRGETGR